MFQGAIRAFFCIIHTDTMCGRFTLAKKPGDISDRFQIIIPPVLDVPVFNAAPAQLLPVIAQKDPERLSMVRWGISPTWSQGQLVINARSETIATKKMFSPLLEEGRCLIPADGFFEWQKRGGKKQPYRFTLKDEGLFAFAGLLGTYTDPTGQKTVAFTILTTEANELVSEIHNRMPVILPRETEKDWIAGKLGPEDIQSLLQPYPAGMMQSYMVSPGVNNARVNHPGLIDPWKDNTLTLF
jgi:putative SOS response-associated peptidase YedK